MERLRAIWGVAGLLCFALAGVVTGVLPIMHLGKKVKVQTIEEAVPRPSEDWLELSRRYPDEFKKHWGEPTAESFRAALKLARDQYIAEACWHCHSQFTRPVSGEEVRFGKVSWSGEYMNELFLPHLFGTRRVGPDLIRESGKHGNDWHVAHFYEPTQVVPSSVMPRYSWFFDGDKPNKVGLAMVAYVQWLGSWATPEALARAERAKQEAAHATP
jgi:cytochrome c oxidase cbb3-type subunit II